MHDGKKKGILLIVIGICIPLFALPFASGFDIQKGFVDNFYNVGIRITKEKDAAPANGVAKQSGDTSGKGRVTLGRMRVEKIPFRLILIPTFILIYIGIVMIDRAKRSRMGPDSAP